MVSALVHTEKSMAMPDLDDDRQKSTDEKQKKISKRSFFSE